MTGTNRRQHRTMTGAIPARRDNVTPFYRQALLLREKALGPDHPDVVGSLNNSAELYLHRGRYANATPLFKEARDP